MRIERLGQQLRRLQCAWGVLLSALASPIVQPLSLQADEPLGHDRLLVSISDFEPTTASLSDAADEGVEATGVSLVQPQPLVLPTPDVTPTTPLPSVMEELGGSLFEDSRRARSTLPLHRRARAAGPSTDVLLGIESKTLLTTDGGNLLGKTPALLGIGSQRRGPIVTDPRVRGNRVGRLAASGSYWVPARLDLDTMLSKIDSRIVEDMIVIKGPYGVRYGPGFSFVDVQLLRSPRYECGFETHASTSADFKANGRQVYGRQELWGGNDIRGYRLGYGHRTGNDYRTGSGTEVPSSYNSRDFDIALGTDLTDNSSIEFSYLRLDQTNVELPGQAFDIIWLATDGFELDYVAEDQVLYDRLELGTWYNQTRFQGDAQNLGKRQTFPFYDFINFVGFTDVESISTGMSSACTWGDLSEEYLTAGFDFRYIKQHLDEITSGSFFLTDWQDANSPIPKSYSGNPGAFVEHAASAGDRITLSSGARIDLVSTNVVDDPEKLRNLGAEVPQHSLEEILGTSQFDQSYWLWSAFMSGEYQISSCWSATAGCGYAERPPNLTELYAAQPFMFLLQNGLNTVTGDPTLAPERRLQADIGLAFDHEHCRLGARGYYAWVRDYITFEATRVLVNPLVEQINLQYVNTELATLVGGEAFAEFDWTDRLTTFAAIEYVEGEDRTRNGDFATQAATGGVPKTKFPGEPRGFFSGVVGGSQEPLPSILPLESRLGVRLHEASQRPTWLIELSARVVDNQDRVASSLLELPTPGFTVWDIRATWQASDHLFLIAGAENFADRNYREHLDFHSINGIQIFQPGVNFFFGGEFAL